MKLFIKWVATVLTILLITIMFIETVPPAQKYRPVDVPGQSNLLESYSDHQWTPDQLRRALLLVLFTIIVIIAIWITPDRSWLGLFVERKRAEQRAKIAESEAQIAKYKRDSLSESSNSSQTNT